MTGVRATDDVESRLRQLEAERDALRLQLAQAEALQTISHALVSTLDLHQVLTLILELAGRVIAYDSSSVLLTTPDKSGVSIVACRGFEAGEALIGKSFSFEEGNISAQVILNQQTLVVDDVQHHPGWGRARADLEGVTTIRSWIGAPLVVDGESIGLVTFDKHTPGFYSSRDAQPASIFAAQAALAVRNARLFEATRRRAEEMMALQQVGLDLAGQAGTLEAVLDTIMDRARGLFGADGSEVWLWDEADGALRLVAYQTGVGPDMRGSRLRPGEGFNGRVFESGAPMIVDDYAAWPHRVSAWQAALQHAVVGVPMTWQGGKIGSISVSSSDPARRFGPDDARLLGLFASHSAAAIANSRLLGETRRRLAELEVLNEIGRAISSTIRLDALLDLIYRQAGRLMDTSNFYIALYDAERRWIDFAIEVEGARRLPPRGRAFAHGLTEYVLTTRQPLFLRSASDVDELRRASGLQPHGRPARSWLGVPMIAGDQAIGVVAVQSYERERAYDEHALRALSTIAAQAAVAVQNARLYEAEQQLHARAHARAEQLALLHRVAAAISSSLDIKQVLRIAAARLAQSFEVDHCGVVLFDARLTYGQLMAEHPPSGLAGLRFPLDDPLQQDLITNKYPLYVADVASDRRIGPTTRATLQGTGVLSTLIVPLVVKDRIIGSFGLDVRRAPSPEPGSSADQAAGPRRTFSAEEVELGQTIAAQIAIAVDNARLYQDSVTRVEQEMAIARRIQQNLFPALPRLAGLRLAAVCRPARETGGDFFEFAALGERRLGIIVGDVSGKGLPAAMLMAAARSTARARAYGQASPAQVLNEVNRLLCDDVPYGTFVAMSYAIVDWEAGRLGVSNGGQILPLMLPAGGAPDYVEPAGPRLPLGILAELEYDEAWCSLRPGDTVLFVTDGVLEAHNTTGELYGFGRLEAIAGRYAGRPVEELLGAILADVDAFAQGVEQHDDITVVVAQRVDEV